MSITITVSDLSTHDAQQLVSFVITRVSARLEVNAGEPSQSEFNLDSVRPEPEKKIRRVRHTQAMWTVIGRDILNHDRKPVEHARKWGISRTTVGRILNSEHWSQQ